MKDKAGKEITKGARVIVTHGAETIRGIVTGLDEASNRVSITDDKKGKGSRGMFSIEATAVTVVSKGKR